MPAPSALHRPATRTARSVAMGAALAMLLGFAVAPSTVEAASPVPSATLDADIAAVLPKVVAWRRDIHQHPELGNREFRTAKLVAEHLRSLGLEVRTEVAHTGVVGVLRGGRPGPVIALRADMDALPVVELVDLPFRSTVRSTYNGQDVGVMHACGHDNHVAMLMGAAEVLSRHRAEIPGTLVFLFQPAEEGSPIGERGGAPLMIEEGALANPKVEAIFGLHVMPLPVGTIAWREQGIMASSDSFRVNVLGRQTHGALPWAGVDPVVLASQIVLGWQTIVSRQVDATLTPSVLTVGAIHGGVRNNIVPENVEMIGTIRTFDPGVRAQLHERLRRTAEGIAQSGGGSAEVKVNLGNGVTYNDPALMRRVLPALQRVGGEKLLQSDRQTTAEDFSAYQAVVPGVFFFLGVAPDDPARVHPNHSPRFEADERALPIGVRALIEVAFEYLSPGG
jgi:amidohydrolase